MVPHCAQLAELYSLRKRISSLDSLIHHANRTRHSSSCLPALWPSANVDAQTNSDQDGQPCGIAAGRLPAQCATSILHSKLAGQVFRRKHLFCHRAASCCFRCRPKRVAAACWKRRRLSTVLLALFQSSKATSSGALEWRDESKL